MLLILFVLYGCASEDAGTATIAYYHAEGDISSVSISGVSVCSDDCPEDPIDYSIWVEGYGAPPADGDDLPPLKLQVSHPFMPSNLPLEISGFVTANAGQQYSLCDFNFHMDIQVAEWAWVATVNEQAERNCYWRVDYTGN